MIHWDEKAKRIAKQFDMYNEDLSQIELLLTRCDIKKVGIVTESHNEIMWYLFMDTIFCDIEFR
jgi:hypothetical protein